MKRFFIAAFLLLSVPVRAAAEPVTAAIGIVSTWAASSAVANFVVRTTIYFALSALGSALKGARAETARPGIKTDVTTAGGINPLTFILGTYATAGNRVCPPYSGPNAADLPNRYLTYVIDFSDLPVDGLSRIAVNGEWVDDMVAASDSRDSKGMFSGSDPRLFLNFHDGTQTQIDPFMAATFGADAERPWQSDMIGAGVAYAVATFDYDREKFNGFPSCLFEIDGIPLYDPRADSSVGGSGAQRFDDPSTWVFSKNPMVMIYNILRGFEFADGGFWGGRVAAACLPLGNWFAAMNECDVSILTRFGGGRAQYQAGFEVSVDMQPADVIDEIKKAASAELVEVGGVWTVRVGAPAMPVLFFTDKMISVDDPRALKPHPGLDDLSNGIRASHPNGAAVWAATDAPPLFNDTWEAEDGGRRLVASVNLPAVSSGEQVQRLMAAWIKDERRARRHSLTLPPEAAGLDPLDVVSWTSEANGYTSKAFEVGQISDDLVTCNQALSLRERDNQDFVWVPAADEVAVIYPSSNVIILPVSVVPVWFVEGAFLADPDGFARRSGLRFTWDGAAIGAGVSIAYEVRVAGTTDVIKAGVIVDASSGAAFLFDVIIPGVQYEARARLLSTRRAAYSNWLSATAPVVLLSDRDFEIAVQNTLAEVDVIAGDLRAQAVDYRDGLLATLAAQQSEIDQRGDQRSDHRKIASGIAARFDVAEAAVLGLSEVFANDVSAIGSSTRSLSASIALAQAYVNKISISKVDAAGALAAVEADISASYGSMTALASATIFAKSTADLVTGGFFLSGSVAGDTVSITGAVVATVDGGSASKIEIGADVLELSGDLSAYSANIGEFTSGAVGGARTEISDGKIRVYNASNQLVVAIGDLTGVV